MPDINGFDKYQRLHLKAKLRERAERRLNANPQLQEYLQRLFDEDWPEAHKELFEEYKQLQDEIQAPNHSEARQSRVDTPAPGYGLIHSSRPSQVDNTVFLHPPTTESS